MKYVLMVLLILVSGCSTTSKQGVMVTPQQLCVNECESQRAAGTSLENGPCLLNPIPKFPEWVCDVAHKPRQEIDNLPENQCSAFRSGAATHFVEVSPECEIIRVV